MDSKKFVPIISLLAFISFLIFMGFMTNSKNEFKIAQFEIITKLYEEGKLSQEVYVLKMEQLK